MLPHLPNEITTLILQSFEPTDILSARLVCRHLNAIASGIAAKVFFETVETDLSRKGLANLENVLSSKTYHRATRRIVLGAQRFGTGLLWPRDVDGFLQFDAGSALRVQKILSSFPNCEEIVVQGDTVNCQHSTNTRTLIPGDVFSLILCMVSTTSQPIRRFSVDWSTSMSNDDLYAISSTPFTRDEFWRRWEKLQRLDLKLRVDNEERDVKHIVDLISRAKDLKSLEFNQRHGEGCGMLFDSLLEVNSLPNLTHLRLWDVDQFTAPSLIRFLTRFKQTLTNLRLDKVISRGDWREVFDALRHGFTSLECITLAHLTCTDSPSNRQNGLFFCPIRNSIHDIDADNFEFVEKSDRVSKRRFCVVGVRYRGTSLDSALQHIGDAMYYEGYPPPGTPEYTLELVRAPRIQLPILPDEGWCYTQYLPDNIWTRH